MLNSLSGLYAPYGTIDRAFPCSGCQFCSALDVGMQLKAVAWVEGGGRGGVVSRGWTSVTISAGK